MNFEEMTLKELKEYAKEQGVEIPTNANKAKVIEILTANSEAIEEKEPVEPEEPEEIEEPEEPEEPEASEEPEEIEAQDEKPAYWSYVGPNIPGGIISYGKTFYGTMESVKDHLAPVLEKYPKLMGLIVPMEEMGRAAKDVKDPKKRLYHLAKDISAEARKKGG